MAKSKSCCGLYLVLVALACSQAERILAAEPQPKYAAVLTVKKMCCAKESVPAIKELSKLPGVGRVSVDYKKRTLMIEPTDVPISPRDVWEAAERVKIEPVRLTTLEDVFTKKPRR